MLGPVACGLPAKARWPGRERCDAEGEHAVTALFVGALTVERRASEPHLPTQRPEKRQQRFLLL